MVERPAPPPPAATAAPPAPARRRQRRDRRLAGAAVLLGPALWILVADLARRGRLIIAFDRPHFWGYVASLAASALFWGVLLHLASRRRGALRHLFTALFVPLFTLAVGVQAAFRSFYGVYSSVDCQLLSKSVPWSIVATLPLHRGFVLFQLAIALFVAAALVVLARRFVRPRRPGRIASLILSPIVLAGATQIPVSYRAVQSTTPDLIYFHGVTATVKEHLGITKRDYVYRGERRTPEAVPALHASPARPRNVLLILQENTRMDAVCAAYDPRCPLPGRFSNALLPDRFPLLQMRANASSTAISASNLWAGVRPTEGRDLLRSAPLLWDYAHAAGYDTAYWTSQDFIVGSWRYYVQDIPVSHRAIATNLDPYREANAGAHDSLLSDRVIKEWGEMKEPFFAVVQYANAHEPYLTATDHPPFTFVPNDLDRRAGRAKNRYHEAVEQSDRAVARLIEHVLRSESGKRTVIVYTSDHGEAQGEHDQYGHTDSIYDTEVLVPTWVSAPPGTLSPDEEASLRGARQQFVWHLDLAPTFLDLLGLWDDPALAPFRARMIGHPLTRPERTLDPVPLTNCSWVYQCKGPSWGLMQGPLKLQGQPRTRDKYQCFNVLDDPDENKDLGEEKCGSLPAQARALFKIMPYQMPLLKEPPR